MQRPPEGRRLAIAVMAPAASLFLGAAGLAAQGVTTAGLNGRVTGQTMAAIIGATVSAVHEPSGSIYSTVTRSDGRYNLRGLRVGGPYTVSVSLVGYGAEAVEGLVLALGEDRRVDVLLAEEAVQLEGVTVIVERRAFLSGERNGPQRDVNTEEIEGFPTINRSVQDFARFSPYAIGTNIGSSENIGGVSIGGKNNRYNNIQVDGAILNDVFGLPDSGTPGGQANSQPISLDAVQAFQVAVAPFDIRQGGFTGGSVNIVTRSGTNEFDGSAYFFGRNNSFVGGLSLPDGTVDEPADFGEMQTGFRVGGPIVADKAHFFVSGELKQTGRPLAIGLLGSSQANILGISADDMARIIDISKSTYGYDPGSFEEELARATNDLKLFARLDFNLSEDNHLTVRHNMVDAVSERGITRDGGQDGTIGLPTQGYDFGAVSNSSVAQLDTRIGANAQNMLRVAYQRQRDNRTPVSDPYPEVSIIVGEDGESVELGIERFSQQNAVHQDVFEVTNDFTLFKGSHTITLGTHNEFFSFQNLFIQDAYGQWTFDSIEDYAAGNASRYRASISRLDEEYPRVEWSAMQLGFYVQDRVEINDRVNFQAGVRADIPVFSDKPGENSDFAAAFPGYSTSEVPSGVVLLSPRLGFNAALNDDRSWQVRGGTGVFTGRNPFVWISNQFSNTGLDFTRIDCRVWRGCGVPSFTNSADPVEADGVASTTEVNITDTNFKFPQAWRTSLAVDREFSPGMVLTLEGIYTQNVNDILYKDLSIVPGGTSVDGRMMFSDAAADPAFSPGVFLLTNTDEGRQVQWTVELSKDAGTSLLPGLVGSVAYTLTDATDVNSGASSRAISNFQYNEIGMDPNNPGPGTADYEIKHRLVASLSRQFEWKEGFGTQVAAFLESRAGRPFNWTYSGDANNDGRWYNDLIYVPESTADDTYLFDTDCAGCRGAADFQRFVEQVPGLYKYRGQIVPRNSSREPWVNTLDLRITQDLPVPGGRNMQLTLDMLNVGNMLNGDWGRQRYVAFGANTILSFRGYDENRGARIVRFYQRDENDDGVANVDDITLLDNVLSRWAIQLGARINF